jgi:hypothetical protein
MKKYLLSIITILIAFSSKAQLDEAKWLAGAGLSGRYTHYSSSSPSNNINIALVPRIGKVLSNSSVAGLYAGGSINSYNSESTDSNMATFNTGLYYQKYYPLADQLFFNWKATAGFETSRTSYTVDGEKTKAPTQRNFSLQFYPGLAWKVSDRFLLEGSIGVASFVYYDSNPSSAKALTIGFNTPSLAINFILN